jgi:hypothetical protein
MIQTIRRSTAALLLLLGPWLCEACRNDQPAAPPSSSVVLPSSTAPSARAPAAEDAGAPTPTVATGSPRDAAVRVPILAAVVETLKHSTKLPILLPNLDRFNDTDVDLVAQATGEADRFDVALMAGADCGGAEACTLARLDARRGAMRLVGKSVALSRGVKGAYSPSSCGVSCAPAAIQWVSGGVTYSITFGNQVQPLKDAANEAIEAGPR